MKHLLLILTLCTFAFTSSTIAKENKTIINDFTFENLLDIKNGDGSKFKPFIITATTQTILHTINSTSEIYYSFSTKENKRILLKSLTQYYYAGTTSILDEKFNPIFTDEMKDDGKYSINLIPGKYFIKTKPVNDKIEFDILFNDDHNFSNLKDFYSFEATNKILTINFTNDGNKMATFEIDSDKIFAIDNTFSKNNAPEKINLYDQDFIKIQSWGKDDWDGRHQVNIEKGRYYLEIYRLKTIPKFNIAFF